MLGHCLEKEHWLENMESWHLKKEIWDGNGWSELQWFWDPESVWALPTRCVHCNITISADHLINSPDCDRQGALKIVECLVSFENFEHCITMAKGSGWKPFGTSCRGSESFEVTVANMRKTHRNHVDQVYGRICALLWSSKSTRVTRSFLGTFNEWSLQWVYWRVSRKLPQRNLNFLLRTFQGRNCASVLLCWKADHPGECETGKFLNQGKCACRRCKLVGQYLENSSIHTTIMAKSTSIAGIHGKKEPLNLNWEIFLTLKMKPDHQVSEKRCLKRMDSLACPFLHKYLYPLYGFDIVNHLHYNFTPI